MQEIGCSAFLLSPLFPQALFLFLCKEQANKLIFTLIDEDIYQSHSGQKPSQYLLTSMDRQQLQSEKFVVNM